MNTKLTIDPGMRWETLPSSGARALLGPANLPYMLVLKEGDSQMEIALELEVLHGWRTQSKAITSRNHPDGWQFVIEFAGQIAQSMDYDTLKAAPIREHGREPKGANMTLLTGMVGLSVVRQLASEWRGHPAGTWLAWASKPGACGIVREVGKDRVLSAMIKMHSAQFTESAVPHSTLAAIGEGRARGHEQARITAAG